jgi:hypothetical protein
MHSPGQAPMHTEADIRAALTELGWRAYSAEAVLSGMRDAGSGRLRRSQRTRGQRMLPGFVRAPRPRLGWPYLAVGAAAAVTMALALTPGDSNGRHGGPSAVGLLPSAPVTSGGPPSAVSLGRDPSAASLGRAMLTAFNATADDLAYDTVTDVSRGRVVNNDRVWSWPTLPSPGQLEYIRDMCSALAPDGSLKLTEDDAYDTIVPRPSLYSEEERAQLAVVCYAGTGQTGCGWGPFNTPAGTWSTHSGMLQYIHYTPDPSGPDLAQQVTSGEWRVIGHTLMHGQQVIKLAQTSSGHFNGGPVYLWVSTGNYLPLRMVWVEGDTTQTESWSYQQPTKATLAHLQVPIPPGYPRSG